MKTLLVLQHTEAEYLGLIEDHFEGRNIRFRYIRPFTPGGMVPAAPGGHDGLVLLGGGPYGLVSGHILPSALAELRLTRAFLEAGLPVIGFGLGAVVLAVAAGGGAEEAPLRFSVETAQRSAAAPPALPARFPLAQYLRDRPVLPAAAQVLATGAGGDTLVFALAGNSLGFLGHPGMKRGMVEDLIMEFTDTPEDTAEGLAALAAAQPQIAESLTQIMVALVEMTGLMAGPAANGQASGKERN